MFDERNYNIPLCEKLFEYRVQFLVMNSLWNYSITAISNGTQINVSVGTCWCCFFKVFSMSDNHLCRNWIFQEKSFKLSEKRAPRGQLVRMIWKNYSQIFVSSRWRKKLLWGFPKRSKKIFHDINQTKAVGGWFSCLFIAVREKRFANVRNDEAYLLCLFPISLWRSNWFCFFREYFNSIYNQEFFLLTMWKIRNVSNWVLEWLSMLSIIKSSIFPRHLPSGVFKRLDNSTSFRYRFQIENLSLPILIRDSSNKDEVFLM